MIKGNTFSIENITTFLEYSMDSFLFHIQFVVMKKVIDIRFHYL